METATRALPHHVVDGFFSPRLINAAAAEWPSPDWPGWHVYRNDQQHKRASRWPLSQLPPACAVLLLQMAEAPAGKVARVLEFPDLSLHGAGLHELPAGGFVAPHRDAARHAVFGWKRVASAVLFLDDRGGRLLLPDAEIEPRANRLVIFATDERPHAVEPSDERRRTLALFFYSHDPSPDDPFDARTTAEFV